jgi:hypothetical protein
LARQVMVRGWVIEVVVEAAVAVVALSSCGRGDIDGGSAWGRWWLGDVMSHAHRHAASGSVGRPQHRKDSATTGVER